MKAMITALLASLLAGAAVHVPAAARPAPADGLEVGDRMPELDDVEWLKGKPVKHYLQNHVYVLDFWATWCGPCIDSIPDLNDLAARHRDDVTFIGVAIWPREGQQPTDEFVADMGDDMDYVIAEDVDRRTARAIMDAAGREYIPTTMVVDQQRRLAWVGHPMEGLDEVLEHVLARDFDPAAFAERQAAREAARREAFEQAVPLRADLDLAKKVRNWEKVDRLARQIAALHEDLVGVDIERYVALIALDRADEAAPVGRALLHAWKNQAGGLNELAWLIVDPEGPIAPARRDLELARAAAERATDLSRRKQASILDTLARVHFCAGELQLAIDVQREAVGRARGKMKPALEETLASYERALAEREAAPPAHS